MQNGHLVNAGKTNPIQTQYKANQTQLKPIKCQNKPNSNPIQTQFKPNFKGCIINKVMNIEVEVEVEDPAFRGRNQTQFTKCPQACRRGVSNAMGNIRGANDVQINPEAKFVLIGDEIKCIIKDVQNRLFDNHFFL